MQGGVMYVTLLKKEVGGVCLTLGRASGRR